MSAALEEGDQGPSGPTERRDQGPSGPTERRDQGPGWSVGPLTRTHFVRYAGASGDFNPVHHDDTVARAGGYPSVFGHGMFTAGVLATYLTRWLGRENLRRYKARFRTQVFPDDVLTCEAEIVARYEDGGEERVDVECRVLRQTGEVAVQGWATAAVTAGAGS